MLMQNMFFYVTTQKNIQNIVDITEERTKSVLLTACNIFHTMSFSEYFQQELSEYDYTEYKRRVHRAEGQTKSRGRVTG
jgi:hypothetical protein